MSAGQLAADRVALLGASKAWRSHSSDCGQCRAMIATDYAEVPCADGAILLEQVRTLGAAARGG
jgi:hypothetical protein